MSKKLGGCLSIGRFIRGGGALLYERGERVEKRKQREDVVKIGRNALERENCWRIAQMRISGTFHKIDRSNRNDEKIAERMETSHGGPLEPLLGGVVLKTAT